MMTLLLIAAAVAWIMWPAGKASTTPALPSPSDLFRVPPAQPAPTASAAPAATSAPDDRAAIDSLLAVRDRLAKNGQIDDESGQAVDRLWLDLLHGRDKR